MVVFLQYLRTVVDLIATLLNLLNQTVCQLFVVTWNTLDSLLTKFQSKFNM